MSADHPDERERTTSTPKSACSDPSRTRPSSSPDSSVLLPPPTFHCDHLCAGWMGAMNQLVLDAT
jgi:hypothetical protein